MYIHKCTTVYIYKALFFRNKSPPQKKKSDFFPLQLPIILLLGHQALQDQKNLCLFTLILKSNFKTGEY